MPIPNRLIKSTSLYLLQHAYNPIEWYPWSAEALSRAKQENKPILLSIGYAACHWCHVMAREIFEDSEVASIMNQYFVCIKVDREERPDVDQVYIEAVQAMGLQAGWPLHVFLLPDQKPFYGGTYFSNASWKALLTQIATAFQQHRSQLEDSAVQFTQTLYAYSIGLGKKSKDPSRLNLATLQHVFQKIYQDLDTVLGGIQGVPKFPMPSLNMFLLQYYELTHDQCALDQLTTTLTQIACGGIYDQLGGGFARYATDTDWLIPHFEKMLYDNAQLISLYSQAYLITPKKLYKEVIEQTIACMQQEMMDVRGGFYSSIDADSEGIEGKFYTWTHQEITHVLQEDASCFVRYYPLISWGHRGQEACILARNLNLLPTKAETVKLQVAAQALLTVRSKRMKPHVDNKISTSWNGMMLQALIDAYYALGTLQFLELAYKNAVFMQQYLIRYNQLSHYYYEGKLGSNSYLEDYSWLARAFISLYQVTFEETWLEQAMCFVNYAIEHFWDEEMHLFYSTATGADRLIARPREIFDQTIPSSNAVMAHNLFYLSALLGQKAYAIKAQQMIDSITPLLYKTPLYLTYWASLYTLQLQQVITVAIIGPQCKAWGYEIKKRYPHVLLTGTTTESIMPLLKDKKQSDGQSVIYICYDQACQLPAKSLEEAFAQLNGRK